MQKRQEQSNTNTSWQILQRKKSIRIINRKIIKKKPSGSRNLVARFLFTCGQIFIKELLFEGIYRQDIYEIPPDAIRELIINAMVHRSYLEHGTIQVAIYDDRLEITSPGKLPMGQTIERMKEGYSKIRNEALAYAFSYMNLIEHWGSGIPRIIGKVKATGLREPEFIGGDVDLRINIYRNQMETNNAKINAKINANGVENDTNGVNTPTIKEQKQVIRLLDEIEQNPSATQAYYAEQVGVSKRTMSRIFISLQGKGVLVQTGTKRKPNWVIKK